MSRPSVHPASPAWARCWERVQATQHHVVNPDETTVPKLPTRIAWWRRMTEAQRGYQIHCNVPASYQRAATIDKYREIKRETVIQCFRLRWDTCYCLDMTEKTEIREDAQENGLVLCVCIAELPLPTQFVRYCLCYSMHTQKQSSRCMRSRLHNTHSYTHTQHQGWSEARAKVPFTSPLV